jgi:hypothetical protein
MTYLLFFLQVAIVTLILIGVWKFIKWCLKQLWLIEE